MRAHQAASFNGVAIGQRASMQITPLPRRALGRIQLNNFNALTNASMTEIVGKIGAKTFFGPITGPHLNIVNAYKGLPTNANFVSMDLTERDGLSQDDKEVGAIDFDLIDGKLVYVEVLNNLGAGTPQLEARLHWVPDQFLPGLLEGKRRKPTKRQKLIHKLIRYNISNTGTRFVWQPNFGGAIIKRMFFIYAGTDWTSSANGNLYQVEVKSDGVPVHERISCLANRFWQQEHDRVPQARTYVVDLVADHVYRQAMPTANADGTPRNIEVALDLTASDNITVYVEMLDVLENQ